MFNDLAYCNHCLTANERRTTCVLCGCWVGEAARTQQELLDLMLSALLGNEHDQKLIWICLKSREKKDA